MGPHAEDAGRSRLGRELRLAGAALELYGLGDAELEPLREGFAWAFGVRTRDRGRFVLRLYGLPPAAEGGQSRGQAASGTRSSTSLRSPEVLRSQLGWLSAFGRDTDLRVPEPVRTVDGMLVGRVDVRGTPWARHATLVGWVPGEHRGGDLSEGDMRAVGAFAAAMHAHAERYVSPEGSAFPRWDWDWPFGAEAPLWGEGAAFYTGDDLDVFRAAARRIRGVLGEVGYGGEAFGLVHRDLNLRNVVFSEAGAGVVDFDMSGLGHYMLDLSVVRRSLMSLPEEARGVLWDAFLEGYEGARPLPGPGREGLERYLPAFDAMQRVAAVNRRLALLDSEDPREAARSARFLSNSVVWLKRRASSWAALP